MTGHRPCELCGSEELVLRYALPHPIFRCPNCGLMVSQLAWDGTDTSDWYSSEFFAHEYWQQHDPDRSPDLAVYRRVLDFLAQRGVAHGRLLDVGCGLGVFMAAAQARGFAVEGTEVSNYAAEYVRGKLGVPVFLGDLGQAGYPTESFDVVTLWDVLEHVQRPSALLHTVYRITKAEGWLVVRAPSEDTLLNRIAHGIYVLSGGRAQGLAQRMHEYYHLYYWTRETLTTWLERFGWQIVVRWPGEVHLSRVVAPRLVKLGMQVLYWFQALSDMQYEQVLIAHKPGPAAGRAGG